jgi:GNAT superfamily N-acetyltransferase
VFSDAENSAAGRGALHRRTPPISRGRLAYAAPGRWVRAAPQRAERAAASRPSTRRAAVTSRWAAATDERGPGSGRRSWPHHEKGTAMTAMLTGRRQVTLRELGAGDAAVLDAVFAGLSTASRFRRFHGAMPRMSAAVRDRLSAVDGRRHLAVAAFAPTGPVGIARLITVGPRRAELAVEVVDAWHGRGVGSRLVHAIVERGRTVGITPMSAPVAAPMLVRPHPPRFERAAVKNPDRTRPCSVPRRSPPCCSPWMQPSGRRVAGRPRAGRPAVDHPHRRCVCWCTRCWGASSTACSWPRCSCCSARVRRSGGCRCSAARCSSR